MFFVSKLSLLFIYSFLCWNPVCCNWYRKTYQSTIVLLYKYYLCSAFAAVIGFVVVYVKVKPYKYNVRNLKHFLYLDKCRTQSDVAGCHQLDRYCNSAPHQNFQENQCIQEHVSGGSSCPVEGWMHWDPYSTKCNDVWSWHRSVEGKYTGVNF